MTPGGEKLYDSDSMTYETRPYRARRDRRTARDPRPTYDRHDRQPRRELVTDGGTSRQRFEVPEPGDLVRDRKQGDLLVVVARHLETTADAWHIDAIDGRPTVADVNPQFAADAPVVVAVYDEEDTPPGDLRAKAYAGEVKTYTFPADRLEVVDAGGEQ